MESPRTCRRTATALRVSVLLIVLLAACSSGTAPPTPAGAPTGLSVNAAPAPYPTRFADELLGPMTTLPACDVEVKPNPEASSIPGLVLPEGAIAVSVDVAGDLTQVQGYVPLTPIQVLDTYVRRTDMTIVAAEHEVFESEVAFEVTVARSGEGELRRRVYLKTQVVCATGSNFNALVSDVR